MSEPTGLNSSAFEWRPSGGEHFVYVFDEWDIDKAKRVLQAAPREVHQLPMSESVLSFVGEPNKVTLFGVYVDWAKAQTDVVDVTVPLFIVPYRGAHMVIDGWTRIAKGGVLQKLPTLPAVLFTEAEAASFFRSRRPGWRPPRVRAAAAPKRLPKHPSGGYAHLGCRCRGCRPRKDKAATPQRLTQGLRVRVKQTTSGVMLNALGSVTRVRTDVAAWVTLDQRSRVDDAHPFSAEDPRGRDVLVLPEDCVLSETTAEERRAARRAAGQPTPGPEQWGRDHWTTFAYVETRVVDHNGVLAREHMRVHPGRHPLLAHEGTTKNAPPTRLRGGALLSDHDDYDCLDDMGCDWPGQPALVVEVGTSTQPRYALTAEGRQVAALFRAHRAAGGGSHDFVPRPAAAGETYGR